MNIIIFDDDKQILQLCACYIEESKSSYSLSLSTDDYEEVLGYARQSKEPALYILDIVIGKFVKGISLAKEIKAVNPLNLIVFMTSFPQYILYDTASKVLSMNIILKTKERFSLEFKDTLCLAETMLQKERVFRCYSRIDGYSIIPFEDIYYFERLKNSEKICLYHKNGVVTFNRTLTEIMTLLDKNFVRCHQSFIVNIQAIRRVDSKSKRLVLNGGHVCCFSKRHKKELARCLNLN